jgi:integrase
MAKRDLPDDTVGANQLAVKAKLEPERGRAVYKLEGHQGLTLHARGDGTGSWMLRYRILGKQREHVLHNDARKAILAEVIDAKDRWLARVKLEGVDPKADLEAKVREQAAVTDTFGLLFDDWLERHAKPKKKSWQADEILWLRHIEKRMAKLVPTAIKRTDLVAILDDITRASTPTQANKCQSLVSAVFSWGVNSGRLETSPAYRLPKRAKDVARERVLTDDEIRRLWSESSDAGAIGDAVRVLMLTGQRRSEVAGMSAAEIDLLGDAWVIPSSRTKNKVIHRVPLARETRDIIARRLADGNRHVFAGRADNASGFVSPDAITRFLWKLKIGEPSATVHDIRRTVGTRMAEMRVPKDVRAAVLNHVNGARSSVTDAVYNQYEGEDEKRRALRLWQARLRNILNGRKLHLLRWHY